MRLVELHYDSLPPPPREELTLLSPSQNAIANLHLLSFPPLRKKTDRQIIFNKTPPDTPRLRGLPRVCPLPRRIFPPLCLLSQDPRNVLPSGTDLFKASAPRDLP